VIPLKISDDFIPDSEDFRMNEWLRRGKVLSQY
jgi:hypothetical protein